MNRNKNLINGKEKIKNIDNLNYNLYMYSLLEEAYEDINKLNEDNGKKTQTFLNIIATYFSELHNGLKTKEAHQFLEECFDIIANNMKSGGEMLNFELLMNRFKEVGQEIEPIYDLAAIYRGMSITILCDPFTFYPDRKKED